eukprot:scaffold920_cov135-Isochrysis_galbana.AAC.4
MQAGWQSTQHGSMSHAHGHLTPPAPLRLRPTTHTLWLAPALAQPPSTRCDVVCRQTCHPRLRLPSALGLIEPRQLFTQPMKDENDPEPGSKRVRPSSADESSMQVRLRARASACGTPWPGPAHWLALLTPDTGLGQWPELAALSKGKVCCKYSYEYCKPKYDTDANAPWGHSGNLKKGTSPEGKGR